MTTGKTCDECSLCCKLLTIRILEKPAGIMCMHCSPGKGCYIYDNRPEPCRMFECLWLKSDMPEGLKPSRCGVVFRLAKDKQHLIGIVDSDLQETSASSIIAEFGRRLDLRGIGLFLVTANSGKTKAANKTALALLAIGIKVQGYNNFVDEFESGKTSLP